MSDIIKKERYKIVKEKILSQLELLRQLENVLSFSKIPLPKHLVGARKAYGDFLAELEAKLAELEGKE